MSARRRGKPLEDDPVLSRWMSLGVAAIAFQVAVLTAYIPLEIVGPDPDRAPWLWTVPAWIATVTALGTMILRRFYGRIFR